MTSNEDRSDDLFVEINGPIANFTLNRPKRLNALTISLAKRILDTFLSLEKDESIKVVVLSGSGDRAFSAGGDTKEFGSTLNPAEYIRDLTGHLHALVKAFRKSHILTIASVNGAVAGAGMGLCLATDFRIASAKSRFNLAFINLALSPDTSSTFFLPRLVGLSAATQIALLGDTIQAQEAADLGLVHYIVREDELESKTAELATRCTNAPRLAVKRTKQLLNRSFHSSLSEQLERERTYVVECAETDDFQEGLRAFLEKRTPKYE
ncbi:MAG: enoyl-CoA hydratase/isomerase family protein [Candidatus Heimdallarchaeota archaeon]